MADRSRRFHEQAVAPPGRAAVAGPALITLALTCFSLCLSPLTAWAQIAQFSVYQGRLTDDSGTPMTGQVNLELRLYDVATQGSPLYSEQHLAVALDPEGVFSAALGSGTSPSGTYNATLLSDGPLYMEVVVGGVTLSPRQPISSAPTALMAEAARGLQGAPGLIPDFNAVQTAVAGNSAAIAAFPLSKLPLLAKGWNLTCASVEIVEQESFSASDCQKAGLSFSCADVLLVAELSDVVAGCDFDFSPVDFNFSDGSIKNCSCLND